MDDRISPYSWEEILRKFPLEPRNRCPPSLRRPGRRSADRFLMVA